MPGTHVIRKLCIITNHPMTGLGLPTFAKIFPMFSKYFGSLWKMLMELAK